MSESNKAVRFLSKIGEGIFNPARGEESRNQPFLGLYIPADERAGLLRELSAKAAADGWRRIPRVFDGDTLVARPARDDLPASGVAGPRSRGLEIPLGEPFTLDDADGVTLRRSRGSNVLLLGDTDDDLSDLAIRGALHSVILAASDSDVPVTVIDFIGDEFLDRGLTVMDVASAFGASYTRSRGAEAALRGLADETAQRVRAEDYRSTPRVLVLYGLQRALSLTPVDPYEADAESPSLSALLAAILCGGPDFGIHTVISTDRLKSVELRLGSDVLPELGLRVVGSSADQVDLATATGQYGDMPAPRNGQLLIADQVRGTTRRVRGYAVLTDKTLPDLPPA
jgi:hypothetical protein